MRKYHWLLVKYQPDDNWSIEFGDYDLSVVKEEKRDTKAAKKTIVTLESDTQAAIDIVVETMNKNWRKETC